MRRVAVVTLRITIAADYPRRPTLRPATEVLEEAIVDSLLHLECVERPVQIQVEIQDAQ